MRDDLETARSFFRQSLEESKKLNSVYEIRFNLEALTALSVLQAEKAARLRGAVENLREVRFSWGFVTIFLAPFDLDNLLKPAREGLGEREFERLYNEGKAMTLEEAVALALEVGYVGRVWHLVE